MTFPKCICPWKASSSLGDSCDWVDCWARGMGDVVSMGNGTISNHRVGEKESRQRSIRTGEVNKK